MLYAPVSRSLRVGRTPGVRVRPPTGTQSVKFTNREFVSDIQVSNALPNVFRVDKSHFITPANSALFPWLSSISRNFEEYKIDEFHVTYEPSCTSGTTGQIAIGIDYDPVDPAPTSWQELTAWKGSKHGSVWAPLSFSADANIRSRGVYYTGFQGLGATINDPREFAAGKLYIATDGVTNGGVAFANGTAIGKVYLNYTVTLKVPQTNNDFVASAVSPGGYLAASPTQLAAMTAAAVGPVQIQNVFWNIDNEDFRKGTLPFRFVTPGAASALQAQTNWEGYIVRKVRKGDVGLNTVWPAMVLGNTSGLSQLVALSPATVSGTDCTVSRTAATIRAGDTINTAAPNYANNPTFTLMAVYFYPFPFASIASEGP